jgi:hypothetical protein
VTLSHYPRDWGRGRICCPCLVVYPKGLLELLLERLLVLFYEELGGQLAKLTELQETAPVLINVLDDLPVKWKVRLATLYYSTYRPDDAYLHHMQSLPRFARRVIILFHS